MLKKIKQIIFEKKIREYISERNVSEKKSKVKKIGFLVDEDAYQNLDALYSFSETIGLQRKDIKIFSFKKFEKSAPTLLQNTVSQKDFTLTAKLKNGIGSDFLNIEFDLLVGYYQGRHLYLDLMVVQSKALFKVGLLDTDERLFDLQLALKPKDEDVFVIEMLKYLNALQKI